MNHKKVTSPVELCARIIINAGVLCDLLLRSEGYKFKLCGFEKSKVLNITNSFIDTFMAVEDLAAFYEVNLFESFNIMEMNARYFLQNADIYIE